MLVEFTHQVDDVLWKTHPLHNFPHLIMADTIKCFGIVDEAHIQWMFVVLAFFNDIPHVDNLISRPSALSKTSLHNRNLLFQLYLYPVDDDF